MYFKFMIFHESWLAEVYILALASWVQGTFAALRAAWWVPASKELFNVQPSAMQFFESDVFFSQCFSLREMLDSFLDAVSNQNHNSTSAISRESESRAVVVVYICCLLYFLFLNEFNVFEGLHLNRTFAHQVSDCYTQSRDFDPYVAQASRDGCAFMRFLYFFNELQTRRAKFKFKSVLVTVLVREAAFYLSKLAQLPWPRA